MSTNSMDIASLTHLPSREAFKRINQMVLRVEGVRSATSYAFSLTDGEMHRVDESETEAIDRFSLNEIETFLELMSRDGKKWQPFYAKRGENVVCVAFIDGISYDFDEVEKLVSLNGFIFNRAFNENLTNNLNTPVDFTTSQSEFLDSIRDIARQSSGVQFGAYREISNRWLTCLFCWGFGRPIEGDPNQLSMPIDLVEAMSLAINSKAPSTCYDVSGDYPSLIEAQPFQEGVKSFCAVPVLVGKSVKGVLSFGISERFYFSDTEKNSLLCIANSIGVAINNYKLHWEGRTKGAEFERVSSSLVGVEIAQSMRHNIYESAGNIGTILSVHEKAVQSSKDSQKLKDDAIHRINLMKGEASHIRSEIAKLKEAMSIQKVLSTRSIKELWDECCSHLGYRLDEYAVQISPVKKGQRVPLLVDFVKHIFHNLLLNSLDAFQEIKQRGFRVDFRYSMDMENRIVNIRYQDDGPGLPIELLIRRRDELARNVLSIVDEKTSLGELIFLPGITTKSSGSGYGLYLCRNMAEYHCGEVEYMSPGKNKGVIFNISISFDIDKLLVDHDDEIYFYARNGTRQKVSRDFYLRESRR